MYLKRLDVQGFKTFASRTVFEFKPGLTAVVGPNGSGKCVVGSTLVTLADGRDIPIATLVNAALDASPTTEILDDGWLTRENPQAIRVLSLSPTTLRLEQRSVTAFVKREAPDLLLRVRTRSGREVTATPYHPLFTLDQGRLHALRADELRVGLPIVVPEQACVESTVFQDEIISIEPIAPPEPWVYDLCVAETHNFVANTIVVHNSNVADTIRWVLGEQSYAALRCKRTEDLIYSGGARRAPAGLAEATLTIDNSDRVLPLAFDEVTITRRATRAGDNEYLINKARVRLRDVQELAAALGGSYVIINQGMVDAALTLRAEDRRRLFEDAAGIGGFEARQQEAERRLKETDANLARISDLLTELEPQLRSLKRQAGQARVYHEVADELRGLLIRHYRILWHTAQQARLDSELAEVQAIAALETARTRHEMLGIRLQQQRATIRTAREQLGTLHQQSARLHSEAEIDQRELAVGAERLAALAGRCTDSDRELAELEAGRAEAARELELHTAQLAEAEAMLAARHAELQATQQVGLGREEELRATRRAADEAQQALVRATAMQAEARSRNEQIADRRSRLQAQAEAAAQTSASHDQTLAQARQEQESAEQALTAAEALVSSATQQQQDTLTALEDLRRRKADAEEAVSSARRIAADLEARYESLERLRRSYSGAFAGVRAALDWAEHAGRPGFALVSSILQTPAELETAVEVALGSRLQNIVVEAWQDAEDAIAQLKRSSAGRATFLPLDSLRPPRPLPAPRGQGIVGVAAELVNYDPHYQQAVAQLLGRVLIVEDLPAARRTLGQLDGGWTIVTLGGEQVNTGGAVTGGAQTRDSGTLRRERELRELPEQLAAQQRRVAQLDAERKSLTDQIVAQEHELRAARQQTREREEQRNRQREMLSAAQRRLEQAIREGDWQRGRHAETLREIAALETQQLTLQQEQTRLAGQVAEAQQRIEQARQQLEQAQAADADRQQQLAELRALIAGAEGQARAARTIRDSQHQAISRADAQIAEARRRREAAKHERQALAARLQIAEQRHAELLAQIDALKQQIAPAEAEAGLHDQRLAEIEAAAAQAALTLREAEATQGRAGLEVERARDRLSLLWERAAADDLDIEQLPNQPEQAAAQPEQDDDETRIAQLRQRLQRLGPINPLALEEYETAAERQGFLSSQSDDLRQAAASLRTLIAELQATMEARFAQTFEAVAREFEVTFSQLFGGGAARLLLSREGDDEPGAVNGNGRAADDSSYESSNGHREAGKISGVEILARPPGKRQQHLSLLSGGERSLTAVALLFAILRVNPSPFCVLDEVDAALDEANVGRFRDALSGLAEHTQFVVITHNRGTIEAADTLYGITMNDDGSSKVLSLRLEELET